MIPAEQSEGEGELIIVTGTRPVGGGFWFAFSPFYEPPPLPKPDYDVLVVGDIPIASYFDFLQPECLADLMVDLIARQIEVLIKAQPDWNAREYGAVIYMVGNEVKIGPLTRGTTVAEALAAGLDRRPTRISMPGDLGDGTILAVVHSHPDVGYDAAGDLANRYPSGGLDSGDYFTFEQLLKDDSRFGDSAAFAQYILGPDGILREFNASAGRVDQTNDPDPDGRSNLAKDRPCLPD